MPTSAPTYGQPGDIPSPGDYDGDKKTDLATFRPSSGLWSIRPSSGAPDIVGAYGITGDIPLPLPAAIRRAFFS